MYVDSNAHVCRIYDRNEKRENLHFPEQHCLGTFVSVPLFLMTFELVVL